MRRHVKHNDSWNEDSAYRTKAAMRGAVPTSEKTLATLPFVPLTLDHCKLECRLTKAQVELLGHLYNGWKQWMGLLEILGEKKYMLDLGLILFVTRFYVEANIWANHRDMIKDESWFYDGSYGFLNELIRVDGQYLAQDSKLLAYEWLGLAQPNYYSFDYVVKMRGVRAARRWVYQVILQFDELQAAFTRPTNAQGDFEHEWDRWTLLSRDECRKVGDFDSISLPCAPDAGSDQNKQEWFRSPEERMADLKITKDMLDKKHKAAREKYYEMKDKGHGDGFAAREGGGGLRAQGEAGGDGGGHGEAPRRGRREGGRLGSAESPAGVVP